MTIDEAEALAGGASGDTTGRYPGIAHAGAEMGTGTDGQTKSESHALMERVVERGNIQRAYSQVMRNRGAPGIDELRCEDLLAWLKANWPRVDNALRASWRPPNGVRFTGQQASKIRIAKQSIARLKGRIVELCRQGRGRSLPQIIESMNPVWRGWMNYFSLSQSRRPIEELDTWLRRRLRSIVWRQWKRAKTREAKLRAHGLEAQRAWKSSVNGRGPWWNAGAKHMIAALPPKYFTQLGLVSLVATHQHLQRSV